MTSIAMPTGFWEDLISNNATVLENDATHFGMNPIPSPSSYSNSSADSQESNPMASPMQMSLHQHLILFRNQVPPEMVGLPYLCIREEPVEKFRFRYKSEMMGTHGSILGRFSEKNRKKSYPSVELCNYNQPAIIRCSLYTAQPDESLRTPHTHRLVARVNNDDKDDPHEIYVSPEFGYLAIFQGMGIIHTAKKNITDELVRKKRRRKLEMLRAKNINVTSLSTRDEAQIRQEAELEAKKMNLNSVSLCFEAFEKDSNGFLKSICKPVFSKPINNMKSALTGELKICRIDKHVSSCMGGEEVFILVEKVGKKNIKIKFFEMDDEDNEIWSDYGKFSELDVHHQYAIVFRTPPYRDLELDHTAEVFVQLFRPTDGDCSDPIKFSYKPSDKLNRTRKRLHSSLEKSIPLVIEKDQTNFVNPNNLPMDVPNTNGHMVTQNDPILSGDLENTSSFERVLQEDDAQILDSMEFKNFLSNFSFSEINGTRAQTGGHSLELENVNPPAVIAMDTTCGGFMYCVPNQFGPPGSLKMEDAFSTRQRNDYANTFPDDSMMADVTADGPCVVVSSKVSASKGKKPTSCVENTMNLERCSASELKTVIKTENKMLFEEPLSKSIGKCLADLMAKKQPPHEMTSRVKRLFSMKDECGNGPLHLAVLHEMKDLQKQMLKVLARGPYLNIIDSRNSKGETPLHLAVLSNQSASVKLLLNVGSNPNAVSCTGDTPLHLAVELSYNDCISELLNKDNYLFSSYKPVCDMLNYKGWTPLHLGALTHNLRAIQLLVDARADVNAIDSSLGRTVLHVAVEEGQKDIVEYLVTKTNIDVNMGNYCGNTALHIAVVVGGEGSLELCKLLLRSNADPHKPNYDKKSKQSQDKEWTDTELVEVKQEPESEEDLKIPLEEYDDDDPDDKECQGQTSFDLALNNKEILDLLKSMKNSTEIVDSPEEVVKEEMSPISDCTLGEEGNGLFDKLTLTKLCDILDTSKSWVNLADLLDYSFLVPNIRNAFSPSKLLLNYADLQGSVSVQDIRNFLEALDEHSAVEAIDLMLARQLALSEG